MTDDEIERIRARLDTADALDPREGGQVGRALLAALDEARAERNEAERQRDCERVRAREWQAVARDSEAARIRLVEERDRARREAIEACVAAATSVRDGWRGRGMLSAPAAGAWCMAIDAVASRLRSMLNAPASTDPATCAHDREVLGGTCSDCAAPVAVNGHRPGCHASGLGPPMRIGGWEFPGCGCPPTPDTRT